MTNTSVKKKKETSKKFQLTDIEVPAGGLRVECRIYDIEQELFGDDERKRTSYQAVINPDRSIRAIYNDRAELCSIEDLKNLDPEANIFNKSYRQYLIRTYGIPQTKTRNTN